MSLETQPYSEPSTAKSFCTSCGRAFDASNCPVDHDTTPASPDFGVGRVVTYRSAFRRRIAVVVGAANSGRDSSFRLLEAGGHSEIVRGKFEDTPWPETSPEIPSPLFRLDRLAARREWSPMLGQWVIEHGDDLLATIGDRRMYALSAVGAGDVSRAISAGLPESEITWLAMHAYRHAGDSRRAFTAALRLDPDTYPDHVLVLVEAVSHIPGLLDHPDLVQHVENLQRGFVGTRVLTALLGSGDPGFVESAEELDRLANTEVAQLVTSVMVGSGQIDSNVWARVATMGTVSAAELELVHEEFPSVADNLLDAGRVDASGISDLASPYLRGRLSIGCLSDDQLRELGAFRELARRLYVAGRREALDVLAAEAPEATLCHALDALRHGEIPTEMPDSDILKAVAASLRSRRAHPNALADPSTWPVLRDLITEEDADRHPEQAAMWQLEQALNDVATWRFDSALEHARSALRWAADEATRDEALNIIGFVLYQQGDDERAIAALEKALEGEYSANLQTNIGVIAADMRPDVAAHHVAKLAAEAPTRELQLAAVRHAFGIWATSVAAWDEDDLEVPERLLSTMRALLVAEIPYDDYVHLIQLLARADDTWLAIRANTGRGPNAESAARRVYVAKASHDPGDYVQALASESRGGNEEDWFVGEKVSLVEGLRTMIFAEPGAAIGPASYAFAAIDSGLELDDFDYVTLACGAALSIFAAIAEEEGVPSDSVRDMVIEARRRTKLLDPGDRERVQPLVDMAGNGYGSVVARFHAQMYDQIVEALRHLAFQLNGVARRRINWVEVENAVRPMSIQARDSAKEVRLASSFVSDPDMKRGLGALVEGLEELAADMSNPRRSF